MTPERQQTIGQHLIEEFWWSGRYVVYVNNKAFPGTFEEAIEVCSRKESGSQNE